jgi:hypothetical protein
VLHPNDSLDDEDFQPDDESDSEDECTDEGVKCIFDTAEMSKIHACLSDVVIPSWIERPPTNLGQKSHGKLKADHWLRLFTIFLPLVLPEIWLSSTKKHHVTLLDNFHDLVTCTNIICSYTVSSASADRYLDHYIKYRISSKLLFPNVNSRPNHHYAMHNADLAKFWGPLIKISEFAYERHNGTLQKIKTNGHIWELDFTMLRQICRRGRLTALIQDMRNPLSIALQVLGQQTCTEEEPATISALAEAQHNSEGKKLPIEVYDLILAHINMSTSAPLRHFKNLPHPMDEYVLPRMAVPLHTLKHKGHEYSIFSMHPGNSSISFKSSVGVINAGFIVSMWKQVLMGKSHSFVILSPHRHLSVDDEQRNPYPSRPGFLSTVFYSQQSELCKQIIVEPEQIIAHVAYYSRPSGTFGIEAGTMILIDSLHRNQD